MATRSMTGLGEIAEAHVAEIDGLLAGIRGVPGQVLWTASPRAVVRKDDPPEEDEAE